MARNGRPLTADLLTEEVRFLLKTLLRDDLFGEHVSLTEAEKLLEASLSLGFVEYCAFLKRHAYVDIDRAKNTIAVLPRGNHLADGGADPSLLPTLAVHFARQLDAHARATPPALPSSARHGAAHGHGAPAVFDLMADRFERGEALGQGSLGTAYRARDAVLEREVVLKDVKHVFELVPYLAKDEILRRVREAVMAQAKLDHPHVLRVVDVSFNPDTPSIVVEHAAGGSLRRRMQSPLPVPQVLRLFLQACYALAFAHARGVLHGALKPENVLFDGAGNVRLADFGVARATERLPDPSTSAPPVYVARGSTSYMAPEQLHQSKLLPASDVYAAGILLYELLTGTLPGRRSPMPSQTPRVKEALSESVATAVDDLFDRMTRDPLEERFKDFEEVLAAAYAALPATEVVGRGTLLLYEVDPQPPPPEAPAEQPSAEGPEASAEGSLLHDEAALPLPKAPSPLSRDTPTA